ncbi:unnamed protein product [Effrenium voratum]|nr:unnamed protein product [Effrenium voratum]
MATMTNGAYRGRYVPGKVMFPTKVFNETEDTFESTLRKLNQEELPDTLDLLHALQEGAAERRWAMELLGAMVAVQPELGQQFKSEVLEALTDDDVKVKKAALELLPQLGVEHAADVVEFLTSSSPELRVTAAEALGKMGIWQLLEELRPCLADESSNVVKAGLGAVQRWGDNGQALASSVVSCLSHTCAGVRCEAVKALTSFAEASERFAGRVAELLGDSDNQTKEAAVAYFERLGRRGLRRAEAVARDLCQRRACAAALALGHMGAEHCAAEVAQLLQNHEDLTLALSAAGLEPRVPVELRRPECAAAFALSLMGAEGGKYADSIAELLAQNAPPEMTASLIRSLASMGSFAGGHKGKLQAFLEHPQTVVREAACFAVGLMLKEGEALLPRLQDSQAPVRRQAALALGQLQDHSTCYPKKAREMLCKPRRAHEPPTADIVMEHLGPLLGSGLAVLLENMATILAGLTYPDIGVASLNGGVDICAGSGGATPECQQSLAKVSRIAAMFGLISAICTFFTIPVVGAAADHYGRRPLLIFSFLASKVPTLTLLSVAFWGVSIWYFFGVLMIVNILPSQMLLWIWINDRTQPEERVRMFGRLTAFQSLEGIVVPLSTQLIHGKSAVVVLALFRLAALLTVICFVPESKRPEANRASLLLEGRQAFLRRWMGITKVCSHKAMRCFLPIGFVCTGIGAGVNAIVFLYCKTRFGVNMVTFAPLLTISTLSTAMAQLILLGPLERLLGTRGLFIFSLSFGTVNLLALALAPSFEALLLLQSISGLSTLGGPTFQALMSQVSEEVPGMTPSVALGAVQALSSLIVITIPPVFQGVFSASLTMPVGGRLHPNAAFVLAAACCFVTGVSTLCIPRHYFPK